MPAGEQGRWYTCAGGNLRLEDVRVMRCACVRRMMQWALST